MTLNLTGRVIAKKNNVRFANGHTYKTKAWRSFEKEAVRQIKAQFKGKPYKGPVDVCYTFLMKGKIDSDIDNMIASINDLMQSGGVIENDRDIVSMSAVKEAGHPDWRTEVEVTKLV